MKLKVSVTPTPVPDKDPKRGSIRLAVINPSRDRYPSITKLEEQISKHVPKTGIIERLLKASPKWGKRILIPEILITIDIALDLLTLNHHEGQRLFRPIPVMNYVNEMLLNRWQFTGEAIALSTEGKLLNGQQRLRAIILSGKPQLYHIQLGLPPETFAAFDIGSTRDAADMIYIDGHTKYSNEIAHAIKNCIYFETRSRVAASIKSNRVTNTAVVEWKNKQNIKKLIEYIDRAHTFLHVRAPYFSIAQWAFLYYTIWSRPGNKDYSQTEKREMADKFFTQLAERSNMGPQKNTQIYYLSEALLQLKKSSIQGVRSNLLFRIKIFIKAWNFYVKGTAITAKDLYLTKAEQAVMEIEKPL